jgi:hypothetical protein
MRRRDSFGAGPGAIAVAAGALFSVFGEELTARDGRVEMDTRSSAAQAASRKDRRAMARKRTEADESSSILDDFSEVVGRENAER